MTKIHAAEKGEHWWTLADEGSHNRMVHPVKDRELVREIVRTGKLRVWN